MLLLIPLLSLIMATSCQQHLGLQFIQQPDVTSTFPHITVGMVNEASRVALNRNVWLQPRRRVDLWSPAFFQHVLARPTPKILKASTAALQVVQTTQQLGKTLHLQQSVKHAGLGFPRYSLHSTDLAYTCEPPPKCSPSKYRTVDGSCNNIERATWGQSGTNLLRLVPPNYKDNTWVPRASSNFHELPSARLVSRSLHPDLNVVTTNTTILFTHFGQFLDHDLSFVPVFSEKNGKGIQCCDSNGKLLPKQHDFCNPIRVPPGDPHFSYFGVECLNQVRSMLGPKEDCTLGHGDQINQITHWMDASQVYGSDEESASKVRSFYNGQLKTSILRNGEVFLPDDVEQNEEECFLQSISGEPCALAGDARVNENPALTCLHLLMVRHHNRIASGLRHVNPHWTDERTFQETRRIVIAQWQYITYNEYLPTLLGDTFLTQNGLKVNDNSYYRRYRTPNPSISNAFATAAFRYGHSMIAGEVDMVDEREKVVDQMSLKKHFNNPAMLKTGHNLENLIRGLSCRSAPAVDRFFTNHVTLHLFELDKPVGLDLVSLNIQRGRDHGIPGYNTYRQYCGLRRARYFREFTDYIEPQMVSILASLYAHPDDVDLFIGGILERHDAKDSMLGPTFRCIIGDQFRRTMLADRYFFNVQGEEGSFTKYQLAEIRKSTMSGIICENCRISTMQNWAMKMPYGPNTVFPCHAFPKIDLRHWKDHSYARTQILY